MHSTAKYSIPVFLTIQEVSEILGIPVGTLYNRVSAGNFITYYKFGKLLKFKKQDVLDYIESCKIEPIHRQASSIESFQ